MKIFLSWSKPKSHETALAFREWLPSVIQSIEPYVSSEDINKGTRWSGEIAKELDESSFGILCVTKENLEEPWLMFEAGALSKRLDNAFVYPFLLGVKNSDVKGPLSQFQSTTFEKEDIKKLVVSINNAFSGDGLKPELLEKTFEIWWPTLEKKLQEIDAKPEVVQDAQSTQKANKKDELMEELLKVSRSNQRLLSNPSSLFPMDYFEAIIRKAINNDRIPASAYQTIQNVYYTINELRREWDSIYPNINQFFSGFDRSNGGNLLQAANNIGWRIGQVQQTIWSLLQANN